MNTHGLSVLKDFVKTSPSSCGIYKMLSNSGEILYIGKAKNIKDRLSSYLQFKTLPNKTKELLNYIYSLEVIVTRNEAEALLLESNLIKASKPKFNILLKDDKSFPYIVIDEKHAFPKITKYRGYKNNNDTYFGPFTSPKKVDDTISIIQKTFLIRSCSDTFFKNREKPCILYQMKRCSAPCVGIINKADYTKLVKQTKNFLSAKDDSLSKDLKKWMNKASEELDYERAAFYRDRLKALSIIKSTEIAEMHKAKNMDIVAVGSDANLATLQIFFIRAGKNLGNKTYHFDDLVSNYDPEIIITSFISKFYQQNIIPDEILVSHDLEEKDFLSKSLGIISNRKVNITHPKAGIKRKLMEFALDNVNTSLKQKVISSNKFSFQLLGLKKLFNLEKPVNRIEVYDNSHIQGTNAVGAMIVFEKNEFKKSEYRKFNIDTKNVPDDYHMLREVLTRRFKDTINKPDLMIIDGGLGHVSTTRDILNKLDLNDIFFIGIAKGVNRNSGNEQIYTSTKDSIHLEKHDKLKQFLQVLRDEAHRFAITAHRNKRTKEMLSSLLDSIEFVGSKRKTILLKYFGSIENLRKASLEGIASAPGINKSIAQKIYNILHQ